MEIGKNANNFGCVTLLTVSMAFFIPFLGIKTTNLLLNPFFKTHTTYALAASSCCVLTAITSRMGSYSTLAPDMPYAWNVISRSLLGLISDEQDSSISDWARIEQTPLLSLHQLSCDNPHEPGCTPKFINVKYFF